MTESCVVAFLFAANGAGAKRDGASGNKVKAMTESCAVAFLFAANGAGAKRGRRKWQQGESND